MDAEDNKVEGIEEVTTSEIEEGTAAAETLKPGAGSNGTESNSQKLETFLKLAAQLGKEDLSKFLNDSLAQIGHEADKVGDNAAKNRASVAAKPSAAKSTVKEDLNEILDGEETFTEEFKEKASTLFEAAIGSRINIEIIRLEEEFADKEEALREQLEIDLQEKANEIFEELTDKLDQYLNYSTEKYMEENEVAIESTLRSEITENFIHGLQNLFAEHYITVPEEKVDLLGEMNAEIESLRERLNEATNSKMELEAALEESNKEKLVAEASEDLTVSQKEKLAELAESVEYEDAESYQKKLGILKESYFGKKASASTDTGLITEEIDGEVGEDLEEETKPAISPSMERYLKHISKK